MPNRLAHATSPYLRQHAHHPVDWYPWGAEAFAKAQREDKPIFLSIGYAACHWCHVMARESFEDPTIAAVLNAHFVPVKVDREEHPDVDKVYMEAVTAMTGHGGWPLTVFLTPEGEPFYGGTYFPPEPRHNLPGLRDLLQALAHAWQHDRPRVLAAAREARQHVTTALRAQVPAGPHRYRVHHGLAEQAVAALHQRYDARYGGWQRKGPKFPQAAVIEFLLRMGQRGHPMARHMALHTLALMARGGMYDVLGGGFHRYSVDHLWRVPHFEKMLYDNALLARVYLYAYLLSREEGFGRVAQATLDFLLRELAHPDGGFYASLDADSQGREGAFYVWTPDEIAAVLPEDDLALFTAAYGLDGPPHLDGAYVLQRQANDKALADRFGLPPEHVRKRLERARAALRAAREQRPRPAVDDKILVGWNGLAVWALAEAAFYLGRDDYLAAAQRTAHALEQAAAASGAWPRGWHQGRALARPAYLQDRAAWGLGLLALYRADGDPRWFHAAQAQVQAIQAEFADPAGGWFDVAEGVDTPLVRPKTWDDGAVPSGQSLTATLLLQWAAYTAQPEHQAQVEGLLQGLAPLLARFAQGYGQWLNVLDTFLGPGCEIAIVHPAARAADSLLDVLRRRWRPRSVWAVAPEPLAPQAAPLLHHRPALEEQPTAYVCQGMVCHPPVRDAEALAVLLAQSCPEPPPATAGLPHTQPK